MHLNARTVRFTALANLRQQRPDGDATRELARRARAIEAAGFDSISYAELLEGEVFAPLMVIAQATARIGLLSRVVSAFARSPVLLASAAAWVDEAAGGRFTLGLGASVPHEAHEYLGVVVDRPAARMRDTLTILRALWGEDLPGVQRLPSGRIAYPGPVIQVESARADLLPRRRLPIYLAAAGPLMLRLAGELAEGVILELTTPSYLRWAWTQIRQGAARAGRDLSTFEVVVQGTWVDDRATPEAAAGRQRLLRFCITHCCDREFAPLWEHGGLKAEAQAVREAALQGDWHEAERRVEQLLWPRLAVRSGDQPSFWRWLEGHVAAGATTLALPAEFTTLTGLTLAEARARAQTVLPPRFPPP
ncbi:MAG: LLM class flavin-dependent oxidoreductase [Chloroflexi bacterium]|nr:LLM class flavin-dependent oxidoreductase [Chloroflexota bacterium]